MSNNGNNSNCINEPEVINKEDAYILGLESNVKGYKIGMMLLVVIIIAAILLYIINPVILDEVTDAVTDTSMFNLKSKIVYITISTIVFFTCVTLLGKMFLKVKSSSGNDASQPNKSSNF